MKEWATFENMILGVDPDTILPTYNKIVYWKCDNCNVHYIYKMTPKMRLYYEKRKMKACPYCKGLRQKRGYNVII